MDYKTGRIKRKLNMLLGREDKLVELLKTGPSYNSKELKDFQPGLNYLTRLVNHSKPEIKTGKKKKFGFCTIDYNTLEWKDLFDHKIVYGFHCRILQLFKEIEDYHLRILYKDPKTFELLKNVVYDKALKTWDGIIEKK